jgi:proline iminopeptidase
MKEGSGSPGTYSDRSDDAKLAFVRICSHYFMHDGFLEDGVLIREAGTLAGIPGVLIHGRRPPLPADHEPRGAHVTR